jgi:uncharacterized membrane protein
LFAAVHSVFSRAGLADWLFRWLHIWFGIVWIGLLYYFNFVQVPAFAEFGDEAKARNIAIDKVARRALWWFRWSALSTFVMGILIVGAEKDYFKGGLKVPQHSAILTGMLLGTIMMLNVWGVIWRNQKVVLANAANVLAGGQADPNAAAAGRKAFMASRQNTLFSVSMLWFMVFAAHSDATYGQDPRSTGKIVAYWIVAIVIIAVLELNALGLLPWKTAAKKGLNIVYESVQNVLIAAFGLWAFFLIFWEIIK